MQPLGGKVSSVTLSTAVSVLNSRIRHNHLSASEMWTQRSMISGEQLKLSDRVLIQGKMEQRVSNHDSSAKHHSGGKVALPDPALKIGDVVYIFSDRLKTKCRDKYLVMKVEHKDIVVQKFAGTQLRAKQYRVKKSNVITVVSQPTQLSLQESDSDPDVESEDDGPAVAEEEMADDQEKCSSCPNMVTDDDAALTCDTCQKWCHTVCGGVSQQV